MGVPFWSNVNEGRKISRRGSVGSLKNWPDGVVPLAIFVTRNELELTLNRSKGSEKMIEISWF
jgi:hypothetical protein